jgi:hypothetical protein
MRLPLDRKVPPSDTFRESNDSKSRRAANCRTGQGAHDSPPRRSSEHGGSGRQDKVKTVEDIELLLGHDVLMLSAYSADSSLELESPTQAAFE